MIPMKHIVKELGSVPCLFLVTFFVVSIDQFSKFIGRTYFDYAINTGISFGIFSENNIWFVLLTLLILSFFLFQKDVLHQPIIFGIILGGALGNFIDRISFGGIIDFISLPFLPFLFNLADVFLTIGATLLVYRFYKKKKKGN